MPVSPGRQRHLGPISADAIPTLLAGTALGALTLFACGPGAETGPHWSVRDSAGVTIVENSGAIGPGGGGWVIAEEPEVEIGTLQGEATQQLFQVRGARRLGDGRIAVANAGSGEVRLYDPEGAFLAALGGRGDGPGEFQSPALAGVIGGDTLVVVDLRLRRISLLHPDEGFLRSALVSEEVGGALFPQGLFADRTLVVGGGFFWSSESGAQLANGYRRPPTSYRSCTLEGELVTDFGEHPGSEFFMKVQGQGGGGVAMSARLIPFGKYPTQATGPDRLYLGSGEAWEVRAYRPDGRLERLIRLDREPMAVRDADVEAFVRERVESSDPSQAQSIRAAYAEMPVPSSMPAFASLYTDALGYLWVEAYRRPGDDRPSYDILDAEGRWVGHTQLNAPVELLDIGADYVLGLYRDELGVEFLRLYRLHRPGA